MVFEMSTVIKDIYLNLLKDPDNHRYRVSSIKEDGSVVIEHWRKSDGNMYTNVWITEIVLCPNGDLK
jgi:hypothetical protein